MGRLTLALGFILTGDERLLNEYNRSFHNLQPNIQFPQPAPSAEWLRLAGKLQANAPAKSKLAPIKIKDIQ